MEFYEYFTTSFIGICRFNSQRDGILREGLIVAFESGVFQFPTGWNSTEFCKLSSCTMNRFNSQRDGILHFTQSELIGALEFQFPTGWNSTFDPRHLYSVAVVSIPNGMEFYYLSTSNKVFFIAFQFPTGWNSTLFCQFKRIRPLGFNSQRDGILHKQKGA